jgi:MFS family permease
MISRKSQSTFLVLLVFVAFISLGLPDAVQGVAWPSIRLDFGRSLGELSYILMAGASGYFTSGAVGGVMMQRLGVGRVLGISTGLVTAGLVIYAITPNLWVMIPAAFVIGIGSGAVDAGLNFYAADKFSVRTMSWLHAFFGVGAMLGPVIMSATLGMGTSWRWGYAIIASVTLILTVTFFANAKRFDDDIEHEGRTGQRPPLSAGTVVRMPLVWLQIAIFFVLTALEVIPSVWTTTMLIERFDVAQSQVAPSRVIQMAPVGILAGSVMMLMNDSWVYRAGIMVIAFSNASIFPMLMSLTPERLGRDAAIHAPRDRLAGQRGDRRRRIDPEHRRVRGPGIRDHRDPDLHGGDGGIADLPRRGVPAPRRPPGPSCRTRTRLTRRRITAWASGRRPAALP